MESSMLIWSISCSTFCGSLVGPFLLLVYINPTWPDTTPDAAPNPASDLFVNLTLIIQHDMFTRGANKTPEVFSNSFLVLMSDDTQLCHKQTLHFLTVFKRERERMGRLKLSQITAAPPPLEWAQSSYILGSKYLVSSSSPDPGPNVRKCWDHGIGFMPPTASVLPLSSPTCTHHSVSKHCQVGELAYHPHRWLKVIGWLFVGGSLMRENTIIVFYSGEYFAAHMSKFMISISQGVSEFVSFIFDLLCSYCSNHFGQMVQAFLKHLSR